MILVLSLKKPILPQKTYLALPKNLPTTYYMLGELAALTLEKFRVKPAKQSTMCKVRGKTSLTGLENVEECSNA